MTDEETLLTKPAVINAAQHYLEKLLALRDFLVEKKKADRPKYNDNLAVYVQGINFVETRIHGILPGLLRPPLLTEPAGTAISVGALAESVAAGIGHTCMFKNNNPVFKSREYKKREEALVEAAENVAGKLDRVAEDSRVKLNQDDLQTIYIAAEEITGKRGRA